MGEVSTTATESYAADMVHRDAVEARAAVRRLLGWNLAPGPRTRLEAAVREIDWIDHQAIEQMRRNAEPNGATRTRQ